VYMFMFTFVYTFIFWICLPHMKENMWPYEPGLLCLTWCSPFPSIYLKQHNFILLYGWVTLHCVQIPHFLNPLISCRASRLFP
jgi:hypothetical protein